MSFGKSAFIFVSGAIVGAASLTAFAGYKAYKMLKKNDILYSAVEESVKAGVNTASNELSSRVAKMGMDFIFGKKERKPRFGDRVSYSNYYGPKDAWKDFVFETKNEAETIKNEMVDAAKLYGYVTVLDFQDFIGDTLSYSPYSLNNYGWTSTKVALSNIKMKSNGRWYIDLPEPDDLRGKQ